MIKTIYIIGAVFGGLASLACIIAFWPSKANNKNYKSLIKHLIILGILISITIFSFMKWNHSFKYWQAMKIFACNTNHWEINYESFYEPNIVTEEDVDLGSSIIMKEDNVTFSSDYVISTNDFKSYQLKIYVRKTKDGYIVKNEGDNAKNEKVKYILEIPFAFHSEMTAKELKALEPYLKRIYCEQHIEKNYLREDEWIQVSNDKTNWKKRKLKRCTIFPSKYKVIVWEDGKTERTASGTEKYKYYRIYSLDNLIID